MAIRACLDEGQQARFEKERAGQIIERSRSGSAVGAIFCVALAWLLPRQLPPEVRSAAMLQPLLVAAACVAAIALSFLGPVKRQPALLIELVASSIAVCIGIAASLTGGFRSHICYGLMLVWMFGAVVVPLGIRWFAVNLALTAAIVYALVLLRAPDPGPAGVLTLLLIGGALMCVAGAVLRDRAAEAGFLAREQLDALNGQLAERVQEQVKEIVARAHEVELLNEQLRERVQERSRELAAALRQLGRSGGVDDGRLEPGQTVGRVKVTRLLGEGGMGSVYAGIDLLTNREVALKVLRPGVADASALQRFVGEAAAAAAISHPGVIKTMHVDVSSDGRLYQIMELVDGPTLERRMMQPLSAGDAARIGAGIAAALAAAHDRGVVHRDIKPNNVILARTGTGAGTGAGVRLLDFGLSKMRAGAGAVDATQTAAQQLLGTPAYMSPEQVQDAGSVGPATDVYSLGVLLYRLVGGRMPFEGKTLTSLLNAHVHEAPRKLAEVAPGVPGQLAAVVERCLRKEPAGRPTATELASELDAVADGLGAAGLAEICGRPVEEEGAAATGPTLAQRSV